MSNLDHNQTEAFNGEELLARCFGRLDFALRVLDKFQQQLELDLKRLDEAVKNHNRTDTALTAHRIKGASANVAAHGLLQCAAEIELLAGQENEAWPNLDELKEESQRFARSVASFTGNIHE